MIFMKYLPAINGGEQLTSEQGVRQSQGELKYQDECAS